MCVVLHAGADVKTAAAVAVEGAKRTKDMVALAGRSNYVNAEVRTTHAYAYTYRLSILLAGHANLKLALSHGRAGCLYAEFGTASMRSVTTSVTVFTCIHHLHEHAEVTFVTHDVRRDIRLHAVSFKDSRRLACSRARTDALHVTGIQGHSGPRRHGCSNLFLCNVPVIIHEVARVEVNLDVLCEVNL